MVYELTHTTALITRICPVCGVAYAIPQTMYQYGKERPGENGFHWYCPNGHYLHVNGRPDSERVKELEQKLEWSQNHSRAISDQLRASERSKAAIKGVLTRTKKRVGNGVCPCCNRTFQNLHDHMKTKHPHYVDELPE